MKKIQLKIIAASLLFTVAFWGASCNRCSNSENNDAAEAGAAATDTIYNTDGSVAPGDSEFDNSDNNMQQSTTSGTESGQPETRNDTVKKVESGGSTDNEVRFSSSGNN